ncbi:MAG: acetyl-CoA C-acetyltransferase [Pseudomonadota bacterium]
MTQRKVYVIDGARTPFLRAGYAPGPFAAADLAVGCGRPVLARMPFAATDIDEVVVGCVIPAADEANIARIVALRLGCGKSVPAHSVQRNCASGLQAVATAAERIALGAADIVLAGGTEAMSRSPIQWNADMSRWLGRLQRAKNIVQRAQVIGGLRVRHLKPVFSLLLGLTDPLVKLNMGQTAEVLAYRFGITRAEQDAFANDSHHKLAAAFDAGLFADELEPLYGTDGTLHREDTGLRRDSSAEKLATLRPVFDRHYGSVTAGNSSQVTDGAAMLVLASEEAVKRHGLKPLGEWLGHEWAGVDPRQMGLGPVHAVARLAKRHGFAMKDLARMELNEAFAVQVLACQAAWDSADYAREELGLDRPLGRMNPARLNVEGGAVACGHPVGASGARLVLHLLHALRRSGGGLGVATLCIGGGQGGAMLLKAEKL